MADPGPNEIRKGAKDFANASLKPFYDGMIQGGFNDEQAMKLTLAHFNRSLDESAARVNAGES